MKENMILREAELKDIKDIIEIEKESFTTPWSEKALEIEIKENSLARYLVIEDKGRIVAYGGIWFILYEGHITNIAVKKEYRGLGLGKKIVEGLILLCEINKINIMTLEVRETNKLAQDLYRKYDFVEEGIKENYYADDCEDAIVMKRYNRKVN